VPTDRKPKLNYKGITTRYADAATLRWRC